MLYRIRPPPPTAGRMHPSGFFAWANHIAYLIVSLCNGIAVLRLILRRGYYTAPCTSC